MDYDSQTEKKNYGGTCVCNCPGGARGCHGTSCLCTCSRCESNRLDSAIYYDELPFDDEDDDGNPRELDFN